MLAITIFRSVSQWSLTSHGIVGCSFICNSLIFISYLNWTTIIMSLYPFTVRLRFTTFSSTGSSSHTSRSNIYLHVSSTVTLRLYCCCAILSLSCIACLSFCHIVSCSFSTCIFSCDVCCSHNFNSSIISNCSLCSLGNHTVVMFMLTCFHS